MLLAGDELSHTQQGNNNAYCQDNELSWLNWELNPEEEDFLEFVCRVIQIWRENPVVQRRKFFQGRQIRGASVKDIAWLAPNGHEMTDEAWNAGFVRCLGLRLDGQMTDEVDERGRAIQGKTLLILLNGHHNSLPFKLPAMQPYESWQTIIDTARVPRNYSRMLPGSTYDLQERSMVVMQLRTQWATVAARKGQELINDLGERWRKE